MEMQLSELIEQIKKDCVAEAEKESAAIIEDAKKQADEIIAEAKKLATDLLKKTKAENDKMIKSSEDSIRQAGRNLLITFRESVNRELDAVIGENVSEVFSSKEICNIIAEAVKSCGESDDISVLLNADDLKKFEKGITSALKKKMLTGVTLKPNDNFRGGFRIEVNGGTAYYDYSEEAVTEMLSSYLNPKVTALMKEAE